MAMGLDITFNPRTLKESLLLNQSTKRLLLVGLSRTGTTMLQSVINSHPKIFLTFESIYSPFLGKNNIDEINAFYYEVIKQSLYCCLVNHADGYHSTLKTYSFLQPYKYFGDKAIYNISTEFRSNLEKAFQGDHVDKIIFVLRNPKARISSVLKWHNHRQEMFKLTSKSNPVKDPYDIIEQECPVWNQFVADLLVCNSNKDKCLVIPYEDFVTNHENKVESIAKFLELDKTSFLFFFSNQIYKESINKWREKLDKKMQAKIESLTKPFVKNLKDAGICIYE